MKIEYSLKFLLPIITASLGTIGKDIDVEIKKDKQGRPYFSGKHIKGILRERISQFKDALGEEKVIFIGKYFGKEGNYIKDNEFSKLIFSNVISKIENKEDIKSADRHGIRIDRRTKTTAQNSLFNYEILEKGNEFFGEIEVNDDIPNEDLKFILACLFHLNFIGGLKSRGLGKVEVKINGKSIEELDNIIASLKKSKNIKINSNDLEQELIKYSYELTLEEPIILKARELSNYTEVRKSVQGSTVRGALIEYFYKNGIELEKLLKVEASDATSGIISLASTFRTKYKVKIKERGEDYVIKDKALTTVIEAGGIKLERYSKQDFTMADNEVSVKINPKTKSAENGMLFNTEFLVPYIKEEKENKYNAIKLIGDVTLPKGLVQLGETITIYIGKLKTKGFGKAKISFKEYKNNEKNTIEERIKKFREAVDTKEEKEENLVDKKIITFDLQSDLVLPFGDIYNAPEQFKELAELDKEFEFLDNRSFINSSKLEGFNIINNLRKIDELIFLRGSVFSFAVNKDKDILNILKKIEENGLGLRKNEGFGRIKICSLRGDNNVASN